MGCTGVIFVVFGFVTLGCTDALYGVWVLSRNVRVFSGMHGFSMVHGCLGGTGVSIGCTGANPFCVTHQPPQIGLQKELTGSYYFSFSTIVKLVSAGQTKR